MLSLEVYKTTPMPLHVFVWRCCGTQKDQEVAGWSTMTNIADPKHENGGLERGFE